MGSMKSNRCTDVAHLFWAGLSKQICSTDAGRVQIGHGEKGSKGGPNILDAGTPVEFDY